MKTLSKKAKILTALVTAAAFCLFGVIAGWSCRSDLAKLKNWKGEFQYPGLRWGASVPYVRLTTDLTYNGKEVSAFVSDMPSFIDDKPVFLPTVSVNEVDFNGIEWEGILYFRDGLYSVSFSSDIPVSEAAKFNEMLVELTGLYGEPDRKTITDGAYAWGEEGDFQYSRQYIWDHHGARRNTCLSIEIFTASSWDNVRLRLGVRTD